MGRLRVKREFDVYFSGEILDGHEIDQVKQAVGELFKISGPRLEALFAGVPVRVKKNLSVDKAGRFRKAFFELGALVQIVPAGEEPPDPEAASPPPARTAASPPAAADGGLTLAPVEPLAADSTPQAPAIDTSSLEMAPASATEPLEQRSVVKPKLPDISGLSMAPLESSDEEANSGKQAPSLPDTSHLEALPPRSGSLEDCAVEKEPAPLPDISKLSLDEPGES